MPQIWPVQKTLEKVLSFHSKVFGMYLKAFTFAHGTQTEWAFRAVPRKNGNATRHGTEYNTGALPFHDAGASFRRAWRIGRHALPGMEKAEPGRNLGAWGRFGWSWR